MAALSLDRAMRQGIRFVSEFSLPPDRHQLRVAAGGLTGVAGSVTSDLEIPDFREAPLEMSALSLASPKASEVVTQMVTNRLQGALPGPPAALREFTSGDVVAIYAEAYPGRRTAPNSISMQVTLRDGNGRVLRLVDAQRAASAGQRSNGSGFVAEMALRDVPVGAYVVHVEARADAKTSVSREIPIRVH